MLLQCMCSSSIYLSNIFNSILYKFLSEIINITFVFEKWEVFLKATLNAVSNSQILHLKLQLFFAITVLCIKSSSVI